MDFSINRPFILTLYTLAICLAGGSINGARAQTDTIRLKSSQILILKDTVLAPDNDTILILSSKDYKIRKNPYHSSEKFYRKLKQQTGHYKITAQLFDLIYVEDKRNKVPERYFSDAHEIFSPYQGMTIREIRIKHVDVLAGNVADTLKKARSGVAKITNRLHINTWNNVIENNMIVRQGDVIDPYVMADNERIIRRLAFVQDVKIYVDALSPEVATLIIAVQDRFSWGSSINLDQVDEPRISIVNRNVLGSGKFARGAWDYNKNHVSPYGYEAAIGGQNIHKSLSNWQANYLDIGDRREFGFFVEKDFLSPEIKYGGGLNIRQVRDSVIALDGEVLKNGFYHLNYQDIWLGRAFQLPLYHERKNLTLTARLLNNSFSTQPFVSRDSNALYYNRRLLLTEVNLSNQRFLKSNYVLSFGISEDIPIGYRFSFISGRDFNQFYQQNYYGFQIFWSFFFQKFGYLLINERVGGFDRNKLSDGVFANKISYYSPLASFGRFHLRNYVNISYIRGFSQPDGEFVSLRGRVRDIRGDFVDGDNIFTFSLESMLFTPWYYYGFRVAPFGYYNLGLAWDTRSIKSSERSFQSAGCGLRIRNESLAFSTLEIRVTHFFTGPVPGNTIFSIGTSVPINFSSIFRFKPSLVPFL